MQLGCAISAVTEVVILFCLYCGSEDIVEYGSGWIWAKSITCFPHFVLEVRLRADIIDVVLVGLIDNYHGLLWFSGFFQIAASNSLSSTKNVLHDVFITTVFFLTNDKVPSPGRPQSTSFSVSFSLLLSHSPFFFFSLYKAVGVKR